MLTPPFNHRPPSRVPRSSWSARSPKLAPLEHPAPVNPYFADKQSLESSHNVGTFCLLRTHATPCKELRMPFGRTEPSNVALQCRLRGHRGAFSLVELIAVMAIMVVMLSLLAPSLSNFGSTIGRKAAVTTLMNTFEQARVAALESGANTYVLLRRRTFPDPDALMVIRDRPIWETTSPGTGPVQLTKWIDLPDKVLLYSLANTIVTPTTLSKPASLPSNYEPPGLEAGEAGKLSYVQFNPSGAISYPSANDANLTLFITEGVRGEAGTQAKLSDFERIAFARFTGRARLDITTLTDFKSSSNETR